MSVYDFNHNEQHVIANHHTGNHNGTTNQTLTRYQVEGDYLNRGFSHNSTHSHNLDMSVQLTRPTSKTAMLVRQRRAMLEQLGCYLCKGYLIDATTIDECMDSFCKSCIVVYLRNHNNCPKCGTLIHKTNPMSTIRSDKVLQDIVYKLVPGLYDDEMKRRREFYKGMFATSSSDDDEDGSSSSFAGRCSNLSGEQYGVISHPKAFYKPTDNIDLSIEPQTRGDNNSAIYYDNKRQSIVTCFTGNFPQQKQPQRGSIFSTVDSQQFKTYLRCPAKLTALQLKKFIAAKFNICKDDTIHLLYLNESLKDEYSLIDIAYIYDWRGIEHMRMFYIIERDLSKTDYNLNESCQVEGQLRNAKRQLSVGTSTQTVKRVCIDPEPRFYEENNDNIVNHPSGRSMRSKTETVARSNKTISNQTPQTPILRYYSSGRGSSFQRDEQATTSNGATNREFIVQGQRETAQAPFANSVGSAIDELSHLSSKDTRSSRKLIADSAGSIPKINININSLSSRTPDSGVNGGINNYSRAQADMTKQSDTRQLVPYVREGYTAATAVAGPSQGSMVTMASFTETRNDHIVSMSSNSTATITSSYKNIIGAAGSSPKLDAKSDLRPGQNSKPPAATPVAQLAFSYVTERGITIVRRLNSNDETSTLTSSPAIAAKANPLPALMAPPPHPPPHPHPQTSQSSGMSSMGRSPSSSHYSPPGTSSGSQSSASTSASSAGGHDGGTSVARHHMKVKPVYKTFVDPTKLKSPNFKKLGYTARH